MPIIAPSFETPIDNTLQLAALARIMSDAFSAIMMVGAFVLLPTRNGMIDASMTRKPCMPWTRSSASRRGYG
jgi:hypothetical protein